MDFSKLNEEICDELRPHLLEALRKRGITTGCIVTEGPELLEITGFTMGSEHLADPSFDIILITGYQQEVRLKYAENIYSPIGAKNGGKEESQT